MSKPEVDSTDYNELYDQMLLGDIDIAECFDQDTPDIIFLWFENASDLLLHKAIAAFENVERYRVCGELYKLLKVKNYKNNVEV